MERNVEKIQFMIGLVIAAAILAFAISCTKFVELPKYVCSVCGEAVWLKTDRCPKCKAIMKEDNK